MSLQEIVCVVLDTSWQMIQKGKNCKQANAFINKAACLIGRINHLTSVLFIIDATAEWCKALVVVMQLQQWCGVGSNATHHC